MLQHIEGVSCPFRNSQLGQAILLQVKLPLLDKGEEGLLGEEADFKLTPVIPTSGVLGEKGPRGDVGEAGSENNPSWSLQETSGGLRGKLL